MDRLRRTAPDALDAIESASPFAWVPLSDHLALLGHVRTELGDHGFVDLARRGSVRILDESVFRSLMDTAFRLFGVTPASLLAMASKGWSMGFKLCGSLLHRSKGDAASELILLGLPLTDRDAETFALGLRGTLEALVELAGCDGSVTFDARDEGRIEFSLSWTARVRASTGA